MKKFTKIITAVIISTGFIGSVASAATCTTNVEVHNSGNGNTTTVTCDDERTATITCTNNVIVGNYNDQEGESGDASNQGNEAGGSVASGSVVNYNGTETTIGASCGTATTSPTPTPTTTPTTSVTPSASVKPAAASLPNTASNDTASIIAVSLAAAAAVVGVSRGAVAAYRRIGNK